MRTKNRVKLLPRAINSVINQTFQDWVLVIVNDGGEKEPVDAIVDHFTEQHKGTIRVIHNLDSVGMEAASNIGFKSIRTRYSTLLDDDDTWAPDFLKLSISELDTLNEKYKNVMGVVSFTNVVYEKIENENIIIENIVSLNNVFNLDLVEGPVNFSKILNRNAFSNNSFLYYSSVFEKIGYYREDLPVIGDWEFNLRFLKEYNIFVIPHYLAFYHQRVNDQSQYGNTVTAGIAQHALYRNLMNNEWLRQELQNEPTAIGFYSNVMPILYDLLNNQKQFMQFQNQIAALLQVIGKKLFDI